MRGDRAVIQFRIDPSMQRAAHQHLPRAERNRHSEDREGGPEMGQHEAATAVHRMLSAWPP